VKTGPLAGKKKPLCESELLEKHEEKRFQKIRFLDRTRIPCLCKGGTRKRDDRKKGKK